jgi:DNA-binding NtrC family response regulator
MELLAEYGWPGNLRELQSILKHAVVEATGSVILAEYLPEIVRQSAPVGPMTSASQTASDAKPNDELLHFIQQKIRSGTENLYEEFLLRCERRLLKELMHQFHGNLSQVATILGISRSKLRFRLAAVDASLLVLEKKATPLM